MLPVVPVASLLVEVDARTGFTGYLVHAGGKVTRSPELKRDLFYVVLAGATNMGLAEMAAAAGISYEALVWTAEWYFRPETCEAASACIVNYHHKLPFAQVSGTGTVSSSDGQRFPVAGKSITAAHLSRYFARGAGISACTAVSDQHATYDTKVIPATVPEAPLVLDEVLGNATDLAIAEHATDTHGATLANFALSGLAGRQLSPRIRDLGKITLARPGPRAGYTARYPHAGPLLSRRLQNDLIAGCWDDLLRVAALVHGGHATAAMVAGKLCSSKKQQNTLTAAIKEYGTLRRTIYPARYLADETCQRRIGRQLNKGENVHTLRRHIAHAHQGTLRRRYPRQQSEQMWCLTLVTNAVVCWMTEYLGLAVAALREGGRHIDDEILGHVWPPHHDNVLLHGTHTAGIDADLAGLDAGGLPAPAPAARRNRSDPMTAAGHDAGTFVVGNVRVFDGAQVAAADSVAVQGGVIAAAGTGLAAPQGSQVVDGGGGTLLPGLIDAHTHVFPGSLAQALAFGVTTELDMFADPAVAAELRAAAAAGHDGADLRSAGTGATVAGGHPAGLVARGIYRPFPTIAAGGDADAFVAARIGEGSDHLKIIIDDGAAVGYPRPTLEPDMVRALVASAHRHGVLAIAHVMDQAAAALALQAGVDGLAHLPVDTVPGAGFTAAAAARGLFAVPTLVAAEAVCGLGHGPRMLTDPQFAPYLDQMSQAMLGLCDGNFPLGPQARADPAVATSALRRLRHAGVTILAGTDAGTLGAAHGASLHRELELLVAAGLTPAQALTAATAATAGRFALPDRGRIGPGLRADLLLVDGDPTTDITATRNITGIWRAGHRFDRETYRANLTAPPAGSSPPAAGEASPAG